MSRCKSMLLPALLAAFVIGCGKDKDGDEKTKGRNTDRNGSPDAQALRDREWGNFPAPDMLGQDTKGAPVKMSDFRGKVVMLDFWATWCGPCLAMIPHEKELVKKLTGEPFVMIGLSGDDDRSELTSFEAKEKLPWRNVHPTPPDIARKFEVKYLPTIVLVDHEGTVRYRFVGGGVDAELDAAIAVLLAKVPK